MSINLHVRNVDNYVAKQLKLLAKQKNKSLNSLLLEVLHHSVESNTKKFLPTYHDLDELASTWTSKDALTFKKNIQDFEVIDQKLWQ